MSSEFEFVYKGVNYMLTERRNGSCRGCAFEDKPTTFQTCDFSKRKCDNGIFILDPDPINLITHRLTT